MPPGERHPPLKPAGGDLARDLELLRDGVVHVLGNILDASNATLLVTVSEESAPAGPSDPQPRTVQAVYKPVSGERPLRDFPDHTLAGREWSAHYISEALGWSIVPPTVLRDDLPAGPGTLQLWVEAEPGPVEPVGLFAPEEVPEGWSWIFSAETEQGERVILAHARTPRLRQVALFDAVANNADRKGSHLLTSEPLVGIDHGLTFHEDEKLRTVLWGFAGEPLDDGELAALRGLSESWAEHSARLAAALSPDELAATHERIESLLREARFPDPPVYRNVLPWPPL